MLRSTVAIAAVLAMLTAPAAADGRLAPSLRLGIGDSDVDSSAPGTEIYVRRQTARSLGPFQWAYGASVTEEGAAWIGGGLLYTIEAFRAGYLQLSVMPGLQANGDGPDLGHPVVFRSGIEVGFRFDGGQSLGLGFSHRSNGGFGDDNPGLNSLLLTYTVPFR